MQSLNQKTPRTAAPPLSTAHCGSSRRLHFARIVQGSQAKVFWSDQDTNLEKLCTGTRLPHYCWIRRSCRTTSDRANVRCDGESATRRGTM